MSFLLKSLTTSNLYSLGCFRIALAMALIIELLERSLVYTVYYSEQGIWPTELMQARSSYVHNWVSVHSWCGGVFMPYLFALQMVTAVALLIGYHTHIAAALSWYLYNSLTLRNVWLSYIADRYFHVLLLYAICLPCGDRFRLFEKRYIENKTTTTASAATDACVYSSILVALFKLQIAWIYFDAGYGKSTHQGWSLYATPLPALDTYMRHTTMAIWMQRLLGPTGLWLMTPTVPYAEMYATWAAIIAGSFELQANNPITNQGDRHNSRSYYATMMCIAILPIMHLGIAMTMVNTISLSLVATVAWMPFLPLRFWTKYITKITTTTPLLTTATKTATTSKPTTRSSPSTTTSSSTIPLDIDTPPLSSVSHYHRETRYDLPATLLISAFIGLCVLYEFRSRGTQCLAGSSFPEYQMASVLLNNRWNVFVDADEYVTWEIAPAQLMDGSVIDLWKHGGGPVSWEVPSLKLSRRSMYESLWIWLIPEDHPRRAGRWRSFPYLSVADKDYSNSETSRDNIDKGTCRSSDLAALPVDPVFRDRVWSYLCEEWNRLHPEPSSQMVKYNFFMLQADIRPEMQYSEVVKRLIVSHTCRY